MPRISVIIPTYNRPHSLAAAVESARRGGDDVEVVVVDDASVDDTAQVCRRLSGIRYVRLDKNHGVAGARNAGIEASSGEYLSLLDDDDVRLPGSLDRQVEVLEENPSAALVYGRVLVADEDGVSQGRTVPDRTPEGDIFWTLLEWCPIPTQSAVFRRSCLERVGLFDIRVSRSDDWDFFIRLAEQYPIAFYDGTVAVWRHPSIDSGQGSSDWSTIVPLLYRIHLDALARPRAAAAPKAQRGRARRRFRANASDSLIWHAADAVEKGASGKALRHLWLAFRMAPLRALRPWTLTLAARSLWPRGAGVRERVEVR